MCKPMSHETFVMRVEGMTNGEYEVIGIYKRAAEKVKMKHVSCGYEWDVFPSNFLTANRRCPKCTNKKFYKLTHEDFVQRAKEQTGTEYTVLGEYKNNKTKIKLKHNICGYEYEQLPNSFISGNRCPKCGGTARITHEEFLERVNNEGNNEYSVLGLYKNGYTKLTMKHNKCDYEWSLLPQSFLRGSRCPACAANAPVSHEEFLRRVREIRGDEFDVLGTYKTYSEKVLVRHRQCGYEYSVSPGGLYVGNGCPRCAGRLIIDHPTYKAAVKALTSAEYTVVGVYKGTHTKVAMRHEECGFEWNVTPNNFITSGSRCPRCTSSKGEAAVFKYLSKKGYSFKQEYSFSDLKYKSSLKFDFAVFHNDDLLALIEYDGVQHFKPIQFFGGEKSYKENVKRDRLKNEYCRNKGIPLIRIPYFENNIEERLTNELNKLSALT